MCEHSKNYLNFVNSAFNHSCLRVITNVRYNELLLTVPRSSLCREFTVFLVFSSPISLKITERIALPQLTGCGFSSLFPSVLNALYRIPLFIIWTYIWTCFKEISTHLSRFCWIDRFESIFRQSGIFKDKLYNVMAYRFEHFSYQRFQKSATRIRQIMLQDSQVSSTVKHKNNRNALMIQQTFSKIWLFRGLSCENRWENFWTFAFG